jgi:hypothetical protein
MTREEANARLAQLSNEIKFRLEEARTLTREHGLELNLQLGQGQYRQNLNVSKYGEIDSWEISVESWDHSGCEWNTSNC